jgi:hypothetical protein
VHKEILVLLEIMVLQVLVVRQDFKALLVQLDLQVHKEIKVHKVSLAFKDFKELLLLEHKAIKEQ